MVNFLVFFSGGGLCFLQESQSRKRKVKESPYPLLTTKKESAYREENTELDRVSWATTERRQQTMPDKRSRSKSFLNFSIFVEFSYRKTWARHPSRARSTYYYRKKWKKDCWGHVRRMLCLMLCVHTSKGLHNVHNVHNFHNFHNVIFFPGNTASVRYVGHGRHTRLQPTGAVVWGAEP